jgi:hypothetical protein
MNSYKLPCPVCGKIREFATRQYFYKARKYNKTCKSCSNSLNAGGDGHVLYNDQGDKCCIDCKQFKSLDQYYNNKSGKTSVCKECSHKRASKYHKSTYRYAKYGISKECYDEMFKDQYEKCPICEIKLQEEIHIDHDHETGKVRGILCGKCNKGLGQFNDNIKSLTNAIKYLTK